jgi:1-acyl-sn-glycerol-3-phosphate acyltransferase
VVGAVRKVRDWVFSIMTLAVFGTVMATGDVLQRIAYRFGPATYDRAVGLIQRALIRTFRVSGVHVAVEGREGFADRGGFIFVSNHQSMYDIPIFGGVLSDHHPRYVAKRSLAKRIPTVSIYLRRGGNALIDRGDRDQAIEAIRDMGEMCQRRGVAAVIFPEGTRSRDGSLGEYRVTGLAALMKAAPDLPIVPTAIDGSWKVFEHNMAPIPYGTSVRVRFGPPIDRVPGLTAEGVVAMCRSFTAGTLTEWREGSDVRN